MNDLFQDLETRIADAVRFFWETREKQGERQGEEGDKDRGFRQSVTGGAHLDGFLNLLADLLNEAGIPDEWIYYRQNVATIPGFFRATKGWDLLVVADGTLLAVIELKSQAAPSFGNNYNNRSEEAVGNAVDLWTAYENEVISSTRRPWLGYFFLLEEEQRSTSPVSVTEPHYPVDPVFEDASYADRYQILLERLLRERLYDSASFILSEKGFDGAYEEPHPDLRFRAFAADLIGHVEAFLMAHDELDVGDSDSQLSLDDSPTD